MLENGMILNERYEILSKIGAGGMSDVYKAMDNVLGRIVAIKVLKPEFSEDLNFVTKFRTEAQSAAGLEHPNIVNVYDVGSENGLHYIVMEHVEGITLKTYIEKKVQLTFKEATSIAIQVARGIEAAHNKEIIHRDIKPQNIIISTEGKVKVTDFGIARAISSNTISAEVMGSVHYASPEQARNGFVDGRSDIYSLGIVMYEMVTGRVPFDGDTTVAVAIQHLQEEMVEPSAYAPEIPISYEKIILKATQKNPDRRYQLIEELLIDLRKALANPDDDFVVIAPAAVSQTRVIGREELEVIQTTATRSNYKKGNAYTNPQNEDGYNDFDKEGEEDSSDAFWDRMANIGLVAVTILIIAVILWLGSQVYSLFNPTGNTEESSQPPVSSETESETQESETLPTESETETNTGEKVDMVNIMGWNVDQARTYLEALGLKLEILTYHDSDDETIADGTVLDQTPKEGSSVAKGTTIVVVVEGSNESDVPIEIPNVVQNELGIPVNGEDAKTILEGLGFKVELDYAYNNDIEAGKVVSQSPAAGTKKRAGTTIKIVISEGKEPVMIPQALIGQGIVVVEWELENQLGFKLNEPIYEYKEGVEPGAVYDIVYTDSLGIVNSVVGKAVPYGATLDIYINTGVKLVEVPADSVGMPAVDVKGTLESLGFVVTIEAVNSDAIARDCVIDIKVSDASVLGTAIAEGSEVTVYVSLGAEGSTDTETESGTEETPGETENTQEPTESESGQSESGQSESAQSEAESTNDVSEEPTEP